MHQGERERVIFSLLQMMNRLNMTKLSLCVMKLYEWWLCFITYNHFLQELQLSIYWVPASRCVCVCTCERETGTERGRDNLCVGLGIYTIHMYCNFMYLCVGGFACVENYLSDLPQVTSQKLLKAILLRTPVTFSSLWSSLLHHSYHYYIICVCRETKNVPWQLTLLLMEILTVHGRWLQFCEVRVLTRVLCVKVQKGQHTLSFSKTHQSGAGVVPSLICFSVHPTREASSDADPLWNWNKNNNYEKREFLFCVCLWCVCVCV